MIRSDYNSTNVFKKNLNAFSMLDSDPFPFTRYGGFEQSEEVKDYDAPETPGLLKVRTKRKQAKTFRFADSAV